jgi:hypothetical protein
MPYIPVPLTLQAELVYNWDGQICENVLHYVCGVAWDIPRINTLGAALVNWWDVNMQPNMPSNLSLINVRMTDLATQTGLVVNYSTGLPLQGSAASPSLPNNCALVLTKRTLLRGRSFRGRVYMPGLLEANVTGSTVAAVNVASYVSLHNMLLLFDIGTENAELVVVSRFTGGAPRAAGVVTNVTNFTSDGIVDSQRRRLPARGA